MIAASLAGIPAFLGAVFAVIWTSKASSNRLQLQFVEERQREEKARLFESRREVYLEAAEAIAVAMTCIGRLADLNCTTAEILKPYENQVGNIAKVHLLAGPDLGALVIKIGSEIGTAVLELTVGRVPLEIAWRRAKGLESLGAESPDAAGEAAALWSALLPKQVQFAERCARRAGSLAPTVGQAVLAIRMDLGMPNYVPNFSKLLVDTADGQIEHMRTAFAQLLNDLNTPPQIRTGPPGTITR